MGNNSSAGPFGVCSGVERRLRGIEERLTRHAAVRALAAIPRTGRVVGDTIRDTIRGGEHARPVPRLSPAFAAQVAMDEAILAIAMGPNAFPSQADLERVGSELAEARELYEKNGWLDDPRSYHRDPPPLEEPVLDRGWAAGENYERLLFPSGWLPYEVEPGAERWAGYEANATASATILRYRDEPRPWVVIIHGFGTGYPFLDLMGMYAVRLHRELGVNVVMPVLPLHGSRRISRMSGEQFLSFDLMNTVHGLAQAIWDIRRVISWVRLQGAPSVGVFGASLGAYTASLLSAVEPGLDAVVAGIPVVDFPDLIHDHAPHNLRLRAIDHSILRGNSEAAHTVVSPLAMPSLVPHDRRFIYAGLGDRLAPPNQAQRLWHHWDEPEIHWYEGNHVGYVWTGSVAEFLTSSLERAGVSAEPVAA